MIAIAYFLIVFNSKYFEQVSQRCENNRSFIKLFYYLAPLCFRTMVIPAVLSILCLYIADGAKNIFLASLFIMEAIEFIVVLCVGHSITQSYT